MKPHRIHQFMYVPLSVAEAFSFFYDVGNMQSITPCELDFHLLTPVPMDVKKGTIVDYRLRLYGIPFRWRSEITYCEPPSRFVDEEVFGPYKMFVHTHNFWPHDRGTMVEDDIMYRLPLSLLGEIAFPLVWAELRRIMAYRRRKIREMLADRSGVSVKGSMS